MCHSVKVDLVSLLMVSRAEGKAGLLLYTPSLLPHWDIISIQPFKIQTNTAFIPNCNDLQIKSTCIMSTISCSVFPFFFHVMPKESLNMRCHFYLGKWINTDSTLIKLSGVREPKDLELNNLHYKKTLLTQYKRLFFQQYICIHYKFSNFDIFLYSFLLLLSESRDTNTLEEDTLTLMIKLPKTFSWIGLLIWVMMKL